jgi:hypothetical protein
MQLSDFKKADKVRSKSDPCHEILGPGTVVKVTDKRVVVKYEGRQHARNYGPDQLMKIPTPVSESVG